MIKKNKKVYIPQYSNIQICERRIFDMNFVKNYFSENGYIVINELKEADFVVLFTCAYIESQENESIKVLKRLLKSKKEVIVLGCLPAIAPKRMNSFFKGKSLAVLDLPKIDKFFPSFKIKFNKVTPPDNIKTLYPEQFKVGVLKISSGCINSCSYCAIRIAVGNLISRPEKDIIKDYKALLKMGYTTIHLIAEDVGSYGVDINSSLPKLIDRLVEVGNNKWINFFIGNLHPYWAMKYSKELLVFVREKRIKFIRSDISSGSEDLLKLMSRLFKPEKAIKFFNQIKKADKNLYLVLQYMVGFPGEREVDYRKTKELIQKARPNTIKVFIYSDRLGTKGYKLTPKVPLKLKVERYNSIDKILKRMGYVKRPNIPVYDLNPQIKHGPHG